MRFEKGFTLVELISIIIILGVLVFATFPKFSSLDSSAQTSRDDIVAALFFAQQVAMARDSSTNAVRFISTSNSVSVTENGVPLVNGGTRYPVVLPSGLNLTAVTLDYDKLGRIGTSRTLSITGARSIVISEGGYAR